MLGVIHAKRHPKDHLVATHNVPISSTYYTP